MDHLISALEATLTHAFRAFSSLSPVWQTIIVTGVFTVGFWLRPSLQDRACLLLGQGSPRFQSHRALTYGFAHLNLSHFLGNAFSLLLVGPHLIAAAGTQAYLQVYAAGLVGCGLIAPLIDHRREKTEAVGASAAVFAVGAAACLLRGNAPVWAREGFSLSGYQVLFGAIGISVMGHLVKRDQTYHLGHLIGAAMGVAAIALLR